MDACKRCKAATIEEMDGQVVCTTCGLVNSDVVFADRQVPETGKFCSYFNKVTLFADQNLPEHTKRKTYASKTQSMKTCLNLIKTLSRQMCFGQEKTKTVEQQFVNIYPEFKNKQLPFKCILAGCCVYSASQDASITLADFCKLLKCSYSKFLSIYNKVKNKFLQTERTQSVEDVVMAVLRKYQPTIRDQQEHCTLVKQTAKILEFVQECWLVSGRSLEAAVIASCYFAWKSLDNERMSVPFNVFFETMKFQNKYALTRERVTEISSVFVKLAKCIPFIDKTVISDKNISYYINLILDSRESLLSEYFGTHHYNDSDFKLFGRFCQKYYKRPKVSSATESSTGGENAPELTSKDVPDDELIPENEWKLYLRSKEEIDILEKVKRDINEEENEFL